MAGLVRWVVVGVRPQLQSQVRVNVQSPVPQRDLIIGSRARWRPGNGTIALPFGTGRTAPVAVDDVARVVTTVLRDPVPHVGHAYELAGPRMVDMTEMAEEFSRALERPVSYVDVPLDRWRAEVLAKAGLPPHVEQHLATILIRLHQENRYDAASDDVERVTGVPAQTIEAFVAARRDFYLG